jgi:hypothetical protein
VSGYISAIHRRVFFIATRRQPTKRTNVYRIYLSVVVILMASVLASLIPTLAPIAIDLVGSLFSRGKTQQNESNDGKYKALADAAMAKLAAQPYGAPPPGMFNQPTAWGQMQLPQMPQVIPQAMDQFQQVYKSSGNPIFAGVQVARSIYDNRDKLMNEGIETARGIGGFAKSVWSKFWDNKEDIMSGVVDMLQKKQRVE